MNKVFEQSDGLGRPVPLGALLVAEEIVQLGEYEHVAGHFTREGAGDKCLFVEALKEALQTFLRVAADGPEVLSIDVEGRTALYQTC